MVAVTWITQQIVFDGVIRGLVYGLLALAIILVFRSTKVINFAAGNLGLLGSGVLVLLVVSYSVPFWLALAIALLLGIAYGAVIELIVIRRLFRAPRVIVLVATIGVAQMSLAILFALPEVEVSQARYPVVWGSVWNVGDVRVEGPQLTVLIVVPVLAIALTVFLYRTLIGRAVRAAAVNPDLARMRGVNPKHLSTVVWAIGGALSTSAMILVGGLDGSAITVSALGSTSLLRALAAALIARFVSFRDALLAGVVIGVGETLIQFNFLEQPGLIDIILLVIVLVVVALQRRTRGDGDVAFGFTPKIEAMPARLRSIFWVRHLDRIVMLVLLGIGILVPFVITQPSRHILYTSILAFAVCALSLTVLTGWAGQLSLGQMAFAGIGALAAASFVRGFELDWTIFDQRLYARLEPLPFVLSLVLGAAVSAGLAALVGWGSLRVRGLSLAISTFALAVAAAAWIYRLDILSGGSSTAVEFPRGNLGPFDLSDQRSYYWFVLGALALVFALLGRLRRSGVGRVTLAVRDNPDSTAAATVRPAVAKLRAFALSGAIAGLGGGLIIGIGQQFSFGDQRFLVEGSLLLVSVIVIGGMGSLAGAVIGALWVVGLPAFAPGNDVVPLLTSSIGLLVLLLYFPGGFVQVAYQARAALYRHLDARLGPIEKVARVTPAAIRRADVMHPPDEVPLRARDIAVSFGGVRANDDVSLEVRPGEIVGLIGTNGAGKTTLMNAIGGYVPSSGRVDLFGDEISGKGSAIRARHGLGRTFQAATLFPELTVRETVLVALEARGRSGLIETALFLPTARGKSRAKSRDATELIDFLGLGRYADRQISELSTGTRRIVELAGLLAVDAKVLCLDEPTAGIAQRESEAMGPLLVQIRSELDAAMLIIEHDMPLIMGMSDRVYCLEQGRVIAEGTPNEVRNDPRVIASYLGTDERTIQRSGAVAT